MKFRNALIVFVATLAVILFTGCPGVVGPTDPQVKNYRIEITYIRENILDPNPDYDRHVSCYIARAGLNSSLPYTEERLSQDYFDQISDLAFKFKGEYPISSNEGNNPHKICFADWARSDGTNSCSRIVGTRIILKVVETSHELELSNIVRCDIGISPCKTDPAKMAQFWITSSGQLKNNK